jgi:branched-chain amino acid transport system substrate-binding protein
MAKTQNLIVLDVNDGSFEQGFAVVLRISRVGQTHESVYFQGRLPPAPELPLAYARWQEAYYAWGETHRWWRTMRISFPPQVTNVSYWDQCEQATRELHRQLRHWFDQPDLRDLREQILIAVRPNEPAQLIVRTQDPGLRRLPWHLWPLVDQLPLLEVAVNASYASHRQRLTAPVKILAVLGNSQGIDIQPDLRALQRLPRAKVEFLLEPTRPALSDRLMKQPWDILFFAGHSHSEADCETGYVWLNQRDRLSPHELKSALKRAVQNGLQLAIFNSCNGLGLAKELSDLQLPHLIVMREPVPDVIAQTFLRDFLDHFAQGESFHLAVRKAREHLHSLENQYPCASWLPLICQNPAAPALTYPQHDGRSIRRRLLIGGAIAALAILGVATMQQQQQRQARLEQIQTRLSTGERVLVKSLSNPAKQAGVLAYQRGDCAKAAQQFQQSLQQTPNDPETLIYLNNAQSCDRPSFTIATGVPIGSNPNVAQEILRGIAQAQDTINRQGGINGKRLRVVIGNDDNHPEWAMAIASRYTQMSEVLAVIGHNSSDASVAAAPLYNQAGLVMISPTSFSDRLSSNGEYIFRMVPTIRFLADNLASSYVKVNPKAKVAICSENSSIDNESYRNQFANSLLAQAIAGRGGGLVKTPCDFADPNFDPEKMIAAMVQQGADTLLMAPFIDRIEPALKLAKANRGRLKLLSSPTLYTAQTLTGGDSVNGLTMAAPWHPSINDTFTQQAAQRWGGPINWRTALAYDSTLAIRESIAQAASKSSGPMTRQQLKDALRDPNFEVNGASGTVRFIQSGERQLAPEGSIILQVRPNPRSPSGLEFIPVKPK